MPKRLKTVSLVNVLKLYPESNVTLAENLGETCYDFLQIFSSGRKSLKNHSPSHDILEVGFWNLPIPRERLKVGSPANV